MVKKSSAILPLLLAASLAPAGVFAAEPAPAADAADTVSLRAELAELRQKLADIERKAAMKDEADAAKAKTSGVFTFDEKGFRATSADKNFELRIRGLLQTDARVYFNDGGAANDTFLVRRARPIIEATLAKDYDAVLVPEFGGGSATAGPTPTILDAYLNAAPLGKGAQLRIGKQKSPVSLEQLQSDSVRAFIEHTFPANLVPNRDIGAILHGEAFDGILEYQTGVFNGAADGSTATTLDYGDNKTLVARVFLRPFATSGTDALSGLGVGFATDYSDKTGVSGGVAGANTGLPSGYRTDAQQTFFTYAAAARANGPAQHFVPQACWYAGPFGILAEYAFEQSDLSLANGAVADTIRNRAWQVTAGWVITGEKSTYRGVTPANSVLNGGAGAWELVARVSGMRVDDDAFVKGYAGGATGNTPAAIADRRASNASSAQACAAGVNWYLTRNLRVSAIYTHTEFDADGPSSALLRHGENAVLMRAQVAF